MAEIALLVTLHITDVPGSLAPRLFSFVLLIFAPPPNLAGNPGNEASLRHAHIYMYLTVIRSKCRLYLC